MVRLSLAALAVAAALCATSASAQQSPEVDADTRCALLGLTIARMPSASAEQQMAGNMIASYYIGRIHGRAPATDISAGMRVQADAMTPELAASEQARCVEEFRATAQAIQGAGSPQIPAQ